MGKSRKPRRTSEQVKADEALIEKICTSLETNPKAVVKAILLLGKHQTAEEKVSKAALTHNGVGFSRVDAQYGGFLYDVCQREGRLSGKLLNHARDMARKYARTQLFRAAKEKQQCEDQQQSG